MILIWFTYSWLLTHIIRVILIDLHILHCWHILFERFWFIYILLIAKIHYSRNSGWFTYSVLITYIIWKVWSWQISKSWLDFFKLFLFCNNSKATFCIKIRLVTRKNWIYMMNLSLIWQKYSVSSEDINI